MWGLEQLAEKTGCLDVRTTSPLTMRTWLYVPAAKTGVLLRQKRSLSAVFVV
tara:strand:+ start:1028 stop:1183 length:156 start_codon:yes stop_codon:yes gene_type:complete